MNARLNLPAVQVGGGHVPKEHPLAISHLHPEHLVEIAIVNLSAPADAQRRTTHQIFNRRSVEVIGEQFHVFIPLAVLAEIVCETTNGLVGDGEESGELDAVTLAKLGFVVPSNSPCAGGRSGPNGL